MLYEKWREIAGAWPDRFALRDLAAGQAWTFGQLAKAVEARPRATGPVQFPQGNGKEFVLEVLQGWRDRQVVCPLEMGHGPLPMLGEVFAEGIVHLKTTSASTGVPRLVAFSAPQLLADAENIVTAMGLCADWPNLGVISLAHSYGFSNLVLPLLLHGIPLILAGAAFPEAVRRAALSEEAVTLPAVPALWQTWDDADAIPASVRLAISAGAPLPLALETDVFAKRGLKIHNFYGSSECGGIAYDATEAPRSDRACAGAPLRKVEVVVAADGCLEIHSQAVATGYYPKPASNLRAGVFRTSDLGEIVEGQVYLRGRACDRINVAGRKVLPETIERVLMGHPQVRACLVFGVPSADPQRGETIVGCVAGQSEAGASLRRFAVAHLPAWQVPREWWFVEAIEVNGRGKLSRAEWRRRYLSRALFTAQSNGTVKQ